MENAGFTKIETTLGSLSIAKSPISVEISNEDEVPSEYKTEVVTTKIDKKAIENGKTLSGFRRTTAFLFDFFIFSVINIILIY